MGLQEVIKTKNGLKHYSVGHRSGKNTIGIELEFDNVDGSYSEGLAFGDWAVELLASYGIAAEVEGDGSLDVGREIVIAPITLDHLKMFSGPAFIQLFDRLQRDGWATNNHKAGGHMTVGWRSFGRSREEQLKRMRKLHTFMYNNREELQKFGRRGPSTWAQWVRPETIYLNMEGDRVEFSGFGSKYEALNYRRYNNTLEFRFFGPHTSFDQLLARYELLQLLVMSVNGVNAVDLDKTDLKTLITNARRSKPNAYREYIATVERL